MRNIHYFRAILSTPKPDELQSNFGFQFVKRLGAVARKCELIEGVMRGLEEMPGYQSVYKLFCKIKKRGDMMDGMTSNRRTSPGTNATTVQYYVQHKSFNEFKTNDPNPNIRQRVVHYPFITIQSNNQSFTLHLKQPKNHKTVTMILETMIHPTPRAVNTQSMFENA